MIDAYQKLFDPKSTCKGMQGEAVKLAVGDRADPEIYVFDDRIVLAINVALATGRPILVRGAAGSGKSTLAPAVASHLGWSYAPTVVTSRTSARDLLWQVDQLRRLQDAQLGKLSEDESRYATPGPLFWAFAPDAARSVSQPVSSVQPEWMSIVKLLALSSDATAIYRTPMPPLLSPRRERAVLIRAAAQYLNVGEIDLERAIAAIAACTPLQAVPRRAVASLRAGMQLLCDCGPGMEPFALDVEQILDAALGVAGRDRVSVLHFVGCPTRGVVRWNDSGQTPYRPPPAGHPVLVLSDFGLFQPGSGVSMREWLEFDAKLRRRQSSVTILFPGGARRIPPELRGRLRILPLDRATGVREVVTAQPRAVAGVG